MDSDKIMTLHPQGKKGTNISLHKYNQIKDCILDLVAKHEPISFSDLTDRCVDQLRDSFEGKVVWYVVTVKLDLEARKIIERIPKKSPQLLRLVK